MKKQELLLKIAAFTMMLFYVLCSDSTAQTNLIQNPYFDDWTDGLPDAWQFDKQAEMETGNVLNGSYSLKQRVVITKVWQEMHGLTGGEDYTISYWYFDDDDYAKSRIWAHWMAGEELLEDDAETLRPETFSQNASEWQEFSATLTAPANATGFRFEVRTYDEGPGGGSVYYDSFAFLGEPPVVDGGHETFDNLDITGTTYVSGTFLGQDGSDWTYYECRGDYEIDGKAIMIGRNREPQSHFYSGTLEGGVGILSFDYVQAFATNVNLQVEVNDVVVAVVTSDDQQHEVLNSGPIHVHEPGDAVIKFIGVTNSAGQVVVDNVIWSFYDESEVPEGPQITNIMQHPEDNITPFTEVEVSAEVIAAGGAIDHVELMWGTSSGDYPNSIPMLAGDNDLYHSETPIPAHPLGTNVHYVVHAEDVNGASATSAELSYAVNMDAVDVVSLAELRSQEADNETIYLLMEEVIITWEVAAENKMYIQDETAAIILLDTDELMQEDYATYDGITGIAGKLWQDGHVLYWIPVADPGEASSWVNQVPPINISIETLNENLADYQARLVKLNNVDFTDAGGVFEFDEHYALDDGNDTFSFKTIFENADYIGESIPDEQLILVGLVGMDNEGGFITSRSSNDMFDSSTPIAYSVVFSVIDNTETLEQVLFAGDMTEWDFEEMLEDPDHNWSVTLNLPPGSYAWNAMGDNGQDPPYWLIPGSHLNVTVADDGSTTGDISFVYMIAGTSELDLSVVKMYPNPTGTFLHIEASFSISEIKVHNVQGNEIYHVNPGAVMHYDLNVGQFAPGMYLVSVFTEDGRSAEKIKVTQ